MKDVAKPAAKEGNSFSPKYSGAVLAAAATGIYRDVYSAVLSPMREYTETEARALADKFLGQEATKNGGR